MKDDYRFLDAVSFAARAHRGHVRKDNATPYAAHVFRVTLVIRQLFNLDDPRILTAAVLHDTIEDTTTDFDDIAERYGEEVARWVCFLTKNKKLPEDEREQEYLRELAEAPWQVKACKLADLFDNMLDSEHLPAEKKARALERYRHYWSAFQKWPERQLNKPLEVVRQLADELLS